MVRELLEASTQQKMSHRAAVSSKYGAMHLDATNFVQTPSDSEKNLLFNIHNMAQIRLNTTERDVDLPCRADLRPTFAKNTMH
jgi:hypothetical protein